MDNINSVLETSELVRLVQPEAFVGWIYGIDYGTALVMTNDLWKAQARGIPHNCFLVAASFNPRAFASAPEEEREVLLLRVVGSAKLPQDDDLVRTKIDHLQDQTDVYGDDQTRDYDDLTRNQIQFSGLECRILGTFFVRNGGELCLGSDIETFASAVHMNVYRPRAAALQIIVNHVDPIRRAQARADAEQLGLKPIDPLRIGTVRYTSTDRLHRRNTDDLVPVYVQPSDWLARRTAVLGMTRTGKSNMIKQMVTVVKRVADDSGVPIGQIIYDVNGEYANANQQDQGAIADIYPRDDVVRYRMLEAEGFEDLRNNFYEQVSEGFVVIRRELEAAGRITSDYVRAFVNMSLDEPEKQDVGERTRWEVRLAAYKTLLYRAGFAPPADHRVRFKANKLVRDAVGGGLPDPASGMWLQEASEWFSAAREANRNSTLPSSSGKPWVDDTLGNLLDMIAQRGSGTNNYISGYRILSDAVKYHTSNRSAEVAEEIYNHLVHGRIVILDLSVGDPTLRDNLGRGIAARIFHASMMHFVEGRTPPNIVVYIEEAHNLIGRVMDLTETWPRLAKEGAKYRIALVYATQEVSSMHPNILANTENWFITHLNNNREVGELARFYDFADFGPSLIRAHDVGFARVKTLSGPFVVPVQIDKFDPEEERKRVGRASAQEH